jgi:lipopolysaccharide export system ATP-binding protein
MLAQIVKWTAIYNASLLKKHLLKYNLMLWAYSINVIFVESNLVNITIHAKDLVKSYKGRTVVNHVSVSVKQGEIVGLLGPNGAGKTTSFYMVVGLIKPDEGSVFLNDQDITKLPMYKRAQMGIGYLPQEASVFRKLTVEDNIMAVLEMTKLTKGERQTKLESLLDEFNLHHVRGNNGDSLSGGERRRTEIAWALAVDPKFILLDEPFAGVDPIAVEDIQTVVARLKYKNIGILITDHNVNETLSICDRAYLLIEGRIFKHGTAEELAEDDQVRRLYLGTNFELKRKDWIIDMARDNPSSSMEAY